MRKRSCAGSGALIRALAGAVVLSSAAGRLRPLSAQATADSLGRLVVIATSKEAGLALPHSTVSLPTLGREQFSDAGGIALLNYLPPGRVQLRVRHIGFTQALVSATVRAGQTDTVRVALAQVAVRLAAVQVQQRYECREPGPPQSSNPNLVAVFDQLYQNADQYRLLTKAYPFETSNEQELTTIFGDGHTRLDEVDTILVESITPGKYRPGEAITIESPRKPRNLGGATWRKSAEFHLWLNLPTLVEFADSTFIASHCFWGGGLESVQGNNWVRVDFAAASRIKGPDVEGTLYLDSTTFQIRRMVIRPSRLLRDFNMPNSMEATSYFAEAFPSISVITRILSNSVYDRKTREASITTGTQETQRMLKVTFLKGTPGQEPNRE